MAEHFDFYFMGCWNSESDLFDHRSQVIEQIKIKQIKNNYKFGLILGDNIYPTFKKIQKIISGNHKGGYKTKKLKGGSAAINKYVIAFPYSEKFTSEKKVKNLNQISFSH